jgi:anti-sigma-K factor RskA
MTTPLSRDELLALAASYAVGACSPQEAAAIEAAMATDREIAAEVAAYRETAGALADAVPRLTPSASIKQELLERVQRERRPRLVARGTVSRPFLALLAASVIIAAALAVQNSQLRTQLAAREASEHATEVRLAAREKTLNALLEAENELTIVHLTSTADAGPGVQFFWNQRQRLAVLHAFRLPPAAAGRAYELWIIKDGKPIPAGVFNSEEGGHALVQDITLPATAAGVQLVAITEEPAGGSPQPTSKPFLVGTVKTER